MPSWYDLVAAEFAKIYGDIPRIECKGLCGDACGPINMHPFERLQIRRRGVKLPPHAEQMRLLQASADKHYNCPALSEDERCTVYSDRPTICRLWGVMDALRCPYGCELLDGAEVLPNMQALEIIDRSYKAGTNERPHTAEEFAAIYADNPDVAAGFDRIVTGSKPTKTRKIPKA